MKDKITLSPIVSQIALRKLGMFSSERLSIDIYYLLEVINLIVSDIGEDKIKKIYSEEGKDWDDYMKKLSRINKLVNRVKLWYDPIQDKKFEKKLSEKETSKIQLMFKKHFIKTLSKLSLVEKDIYEIFISLVKMTNLQKQQISAEAFKILEHTKFKKIDLTDKSSSVDRESTPK